MYAKLGITMWPRGDAAAARVFAISYDASIKSGWGANLQSSLNLLLQVFSGTYPLDSDCSVQVHNEGRAGALAFAAVATSATRSSS